MNFITSYHTDIGIKKNTNQDALLLKVADTSYGKIAFAVMCDGMGGLSKGEVASAEVVKRFAEWFHKELAMLLEKGWTQAELKKRWGELIEEENLKIMEYGKKYGINLGTTLSAFLIIGDKYYAIHVGDCRIYECENVLYQITRDQTLVGRELEKGNMTLEEAKKDPRRNVLLQCIGASEEVNPDFMVGDVKKNAVYILCTDGFRHEISGEEIWKAFKPEHYVEGKMKQIQIDLVEKNKKRGETDNISLITIKTY